jgi:hypothetical protein
MTQLSLVKEKGNLHLNGMTASDIIGLLRDRHSDDTFVSECKNGETWGARDLLKLDAWVLLKTYSPLTTIGYEVKVSRQDFEQDQKWVGYLDLCHIFYFVCPAGLIRSTDLPSRVGLLWVSASGKLHIKKKPERVNPDIEKLNRLLIYVLMARSKIDVKENQGDSLTERAKWIKANADKKELNYLVKGHIRDIEKHLKNKEQELSCRESDVKQFADTLARLGIIWNAEKNDWQESRRVRNEIEALRPMLEKYELDRMKQCGQELINISDRLTKLREAPNKLSSIVKEA